MAGLIATLLTISPLTGTARLAPAMFLGVVGASIWLANRVRSAPNSTHTDRWTFARPSLSSLALVAAALLAAAPTMIWLFAQHTKSVWENPHGVFTIFFIVLLARAALRREPADQGAQASLWGLPLLGLAAGMLALDVGAQSRLLSAVALVVALPGLSLVLLGAERTRRLRLPLVLAVFLVPIPAHIGDPLGITISTALGADWILRAFDFPILRHETIFMLQRSTFEISQNCSGVSAIWGALGFAILLCAGTPSHWRRLLLLVIPVAGTIATNAMRCAALMAGTTKLSTEFVDGPIHGLSGVAAYWAVLALLWLVCDRQGVVERFR